MTNDTLKQYLQIEHKLAKLPEADIDQRIAIAITLGINDFWTARPWIFSTELISQTITGGTTERDELPDNYHAIYSIKETSSTYGTPMSFLKKDVFDDKITKPGAYPYDYPVVFTCYTDRATKKSYIEVYPRPSSSLTLPLIIFTKPPSNVSEIPPGYESGYIPAVIKYLYAWGSPEQRAIIEEYGKALLELQKRNAHNKKPITNMKQNDARKSVGERGSAWVDSWLD